LITVQHIIHMQCTSQYSKQESLADAKVSTRQQCKYEGP